MSAARTTQQKAQSEYARNGNKTQTTRYGAKTFLDAIASQDDDLVTGMGFEQRMSLIVDEAYSSLSHNKVEGLIRSVGLRSPEADLRRIDMVEHRGLNQELLVSLVTYGFIEPHQNVVFQGLTGSGKSYLGCALVNKPATTATVHTISGCQIWKKRG